MSQHPGGHESRCRRCGGSRKQACGCLNILVDMKVVLLCRKGNSCSGSGVGLLFREQK